MQNLKDLSDQANLQFMLSMQANPIVVAQVIAYDMIKQTKSWPPETLGEVSMLGEAMSKVMACVAPVNVVQEFVIGVDDEEEDD